MTYFDEEYIKLLKRILKEGEEVENRTGINTIKLPEHYFKFDLRVNILFYLLSKHFIKMLYWKCYGYGKQVLMMWNGYMREMLKYGMNG